MATSKLLFGTGLWPMITLKLHKMVVWGPELFEGALVGVKQNCARNVTARGIEFHSLSPASDSV